MPGSREFLPVASGRTSLDGRVRLSGLSPGVFRIDVSPPFGFVAPEANPFGSAPVITLRESGERFLVPIQLWRGGPIAIQMTVRGGPEDWPGLVRLHFLDGELGVDYRLRAGVLKEALLAPGRWEIVLEPPPGFLVNDIELNGRSVAGDRVVVDIEETLTTTYVEWWVGAACRIDGRVTYEQDAELAVEIVASLREPGSWIDALRLGGRPIVEHARARFLPGSRERWEMFVPSGVWELRASGPNVISAPESVIVELAPGGAGSADFTVRPAVIDDQRPSGLIVEVVDERWKPIGQAKVGAWPASADPLIDAPLAVSETDPRAGRVLFEELAAGSYLVVASHPLYLEGRAQVESYTADADRSERVSVRLRRGSSLLAEAREADGTPSRDVEVELVRVDPMPERVFPDDEHGDEPRRYRGLTDASGRTAVSGLMAGRHRLVGRMRGTLARERFVRVREDGERLAEEIEIDVPQRGKLSAELAVLPAGSLGVTIVCRDEAPLPGAVSVRVFRDHVEAPDRRQHPDLGGDATLVLDDIPLRGQIRERLVAGPLDEGGYHVAVRPHGFGLWWWLGADDLRRGASTIQTTLGETTEVGIETIFCGPTVELPLVARSGQPPPDVRDGGAVAEYRLLVDETPWQAADVRLLDDRIRVRGLPHGADVAGSPKGRAEIRVRYEHPHLLPVPEVAIRLEAELARGTLVEEPLHVEAIGGALGVRSDAAAVIVRSEESRLVAPLDAGEALVVSLMPGEYEVTVCRDVACEELQGEPHPVTITPARTSWLELP